MYYYFLVYLYNIIFNTILFKNIKNDNLQGDYKLEIFSVLGLIMTSSILGLMYKNSDIKNNYDIYGLTFILFCFQIIMCIYIRKPNIMTQKNIYIINSFIVGVSVVILGLFTYKYKNKSNVPDLEVQQKRFNFMFENYNRDDELP